MKATLTLLFCLIVLPACSSTIPKSDTAIPSNPPPIRHIPQHPKVALALGAGGAKAYAHLGAIEVLHDAGIPIELIAGSSGGAVIGALYADQSSVQEVYNSMMASRFWTFVDIKAFNRMGFISGSKLEHFLKENLQAENFKSLEIPLLVATTDLQTGNTYPVASGPIAPAVDASSSIPGLVIPSEMYGRTLIDGGASMPVPVALLEPYQPQITIAIDIATPLPPKIPTSAYETYNRAYEILWIELSKLSAQHADVIIHPDIESIGMFEADKKIPLYVAGKKAAQDALPKILALMQAKGIAPVKPKHA